MLNGMGTHTIDSDGKTKGATAGEGEDVKRMKGKWNGRGWESGLVSGDLSPKKIITITEQQRTI